MSDLIDLIDKKLLYSLKANGRATYSELGKLVRLSKQAVKQRMARLEKLDIIKQYFALIDINKLGYSYYRIEFRFQNLSETKEKEIINHIKKLPKLLWIGEIHGDWDLGVIFLTKNVLEAEENIRSIRWKFSNYIEACRFSISTTHTRYDYNFLFGTKSDKEYFMGRELGNWELSTIEKEVLYILAEDGRISLLKLAQRVNKSIGAIQHTLKNLKQKKILLGFSILINFQALGFQHHKVFINFKNPAEEKERQLLTFFRLHPHIIFSQRSLGLTDIECQIVTKDLLEFKEIIRQMKVQFGFLIKDIHSFMYLKEHLTNYFPR